MKKLLLVVVMFLMFISFTGCSKTVTGKFEFYYNDEFIGETDEYIENGDMVCIANNIYSYEDKFDYICWDKDNLEIIKVED